MVDYYSTTTTMSWCMEVECLAQFNEMKNDLQRNHDCDENTLKWIRDFVHCDSPHCHVMYWKDKNGAVCEDCSINVCEGCTMNELSTFLYGEYFLCVDCLKNRVNNAEVDYCQNRQKECKNFVCINKNGASFQCFQCELSFCDDCQSSELVKYICKTCRQ